jgi:prepilin-type N-terminal cleavage/methylation domain-containing protein/prepilin-type processing-associated H-X9-DG protein
MPPTHESANLRLARSERSGFTIVELLVVITIIAILVALLLPAVQAARESARRMQCGNNLKQMALAAHTHVDARGVFPTGGAVPWALIDDYSTDGNPWGPEKQGLGWAFQILPYLELESVYHKCVQTELELTPLSIYFCPTRRPVTRHPASPHRVLMDYAGINGGDPPSVTKDDSGKLDWTFWQADGAHHFNPPPGMKWHGVIVRTNWEIMNDPPGAIGSTAPIGFADIPDGASNTAMLGEKRLHPTCYDSGDWFDDRGWTDGWDPDTIRSTCYPTGPDVEGYVPGITGQLLDIAYCLGSAHQGSSNVAYADASVHALSYDIDREVLAYLGTRDDGRVFDPSKL